MKTKSSNLDLETHRGANVCAARSGWQWGASRPRTGSGLRCLQRQGTTGWQQHTMSGASQASRGRQASGNQDEKEGAAATATGRPALQGTVSEAPTLGLDCKTAVFLYHLKEIHCCLAFQKEHLRKLLERRDGSRDQGPQYGHAIPALCKGTCQ